MPLIVVCWSAWDIFDIEMEFQNHSVRIQGNSKHHQIPITRTIPTETLPKTLPKILIVPSSSVFAKGILLTTDPIATIRSDSH